MACGHSDHCCVFAGVQCKYLRETNNEEFKYRCSLVEDKGSWEAVATSTEYQTEIKPLYIRVGRPDVDCWTYPLAGETCHSCGEVGGG